MSKRLVVITCCAGALLCSACATPPADDATVAGAATQKVYRTGSNIAVRDYDARDVTTVDPATLNRLPDSATRPGRGGQ